MTKRLCIILLAGLFLFACRPMLGTDGMRLYDLDQGRTLVGHQALDRLQEAQIVLVGEQHTNQWHHHVQLEVIRSLHLSGGNVAIGLEMFRHERQSDLDRWVSGQIDEAAFKHLYMENWNYDWAYYRPIFIYAREHNIPMVGLNIPREISSQVAHHGFESLTEAQKGHLDGITCDIQPHYRDFIRRAHEVHAHGHMEFEHFCQAQLLWDTAMAVHAIKYLEQHPHRRMVLLAGSGHARKLGIPAQLRQRTPMPSLVVLPETPGIFEPERLTDEDADFLLMAY